MSKEVLKESDQDKKEKKAPPNQIYLIIKQQKNKERAQ